MACSRMLAHRAVADRDVTQNTKHWSHQRPLHGPFGLPPIPNPMDRFLREWRQDALTKHQYESAIFIGDKLLAISSTYGAPTISNQAWGA